MNKILPLIIVLVLTSFTFAGKAMVVKSGTTATKFAVSAIDSIIFVNDSLIFDNGNIYAVSGTNSPPTDSTRFTITATWVVTYLQDYHYYNGGDLPGTISLKHSDGTVYGPFQTTGSIGQGGVINAYWICYPFVTIKPGSYVVIDSDPSTWSHNSQSGDRGFAQIIGYLAP